MSRSKAEFVATTWPGMQLPLLTWPSLHSMLCVAKIETLMDEDIYWSFKKKILTLLANKVSTPKTSYKWKRQMTLRGVPDVVDLYDKHQWPSRGQFNQPCCVKSAIHFHQQNSAHLY